MDKTFAAINKLKEVELELHRLKNALEMMNRTYDSKREWQTLTDEERKDALVSVDPETKRLPPGLRDFARAIEAKLREKNHG